MANITLRQAAEWCGGTVEEQYADVTFLGAGNDTRTIQPGQLFVVLQGARDGHNFIPAAMNQGAAAVLCSRKVGDYPAIYVEDPRKALGDIAREELKRIGAKVVAITGSVGKSTTKEMIAKAYSAGVEFFIQKPINLIEVGQVIRNVTRQIENEKALNAIQNVFAGRSPVSREDTGERERRRLKYILSQLGMAGEKGGQDIIELCLLL